MSDQTSPSAPGRSPCLFVLDPTTIGWKARRDFSQPRPDRSKHGLPTTGKNVGYLLPLKLPSYIVSKRSLFRRFHKADCD